MLELIISSLYSYFRKEELEMKKLIEQRKREKEEEKQARLRVKRLIEADKLARKGINAESNESIVKNTAISEPTLAATIVNSTPKDYSQTKIQVKIAEKYSPIKNSSILYFLYI